MSDTEISTTNLKAPRGKPARSTRVKFSLSSTQLGAKAALKTARSAATKASTNVAKAIARANNAKLLVEQFVMAVAEAARAAAEEEKDGLVPSVVTGTGICMDAYDSLSDDTGTSTPTDTAMQDTADHDTDIAVNAGTTNPKEIATECTADTAVDAEAPVAVPA